MRQRARFHDLEGWYFIDQIFRPGFGLLTMRIASYYRFMSRVRLAAIRIILDDDLQYAVDSPGPNTLHV